MSLEPPRFDYTSNTYLTVYLRSSSSYVADAPSMITIHPALTHVGPVGVMKEIQVLRVSNLEWGRISEEVLASLRSSADIEKVEVQDGPKTRVKRGYVDL